MKIGIYTGLFDGHGIGNLVRQLELARYISINTNDEIIFFSNDPKKSKLLSEKIGEGIEIYGEISSNLDVVLIDSPVYTQISNNVKKIRFDFFDYNNRDTDIIINLYNQYVSKENNPLKFKGKLYQGLNYFILRSIYINYLSINNDFGNKRILIVFGGDDPMNHTEKVLNYLNLSPQKKIVEVTVMNPPNRKDFTSFLGKYQFQVKLERNNKNILDWMSWSDIVFCGGGGLMIEALFMKKIVFAIPQNDLEANFINYVGSISKLFEIQYFEDVIDGFDVLKQENKFKNADLIIDGKKNILEILNNVL